MISFFTIQTGFSVLFIFVNNCFYYIPFVKYPVRQWIEFPLGGTLEHWKRWSLLRHRHTVNSTVGGKPQFKYRVAGFANFNKDKCIFVANNRKTCII